MPRLSNQRRLRWPAIFRPIDHPAPEASTRRPVTPTLNLPGTRRRYGGLAASLLLHGALIGLLVMQGDRLWSRTPTAGDRGLSGSSSGAGGGGNRVAYITLPSLPKAASAPQFTVDAHQVPLPKSIQTPVVEPVQSSREIAERADTAPVAVVADTSLPRAERGVAQGVEGAGTGAGGTSGNAIGPGAGEGQGAGAGTGTGGGGEGGTLRPPEPRDMAFPFDTPPKELRGVSLNVTFWVRADGAVERYQVDPAIRDREYAKKFDEVMRAFRFTPARAPNGARVAGTTMISFTLPGKRSS